MADPIDWHTVPPAQRRRRGLRPKLAHAVMNAWGPIYRDADWQPRPYRVLAAAQRWLLHTQKRREYVFFDLYLRFIAWECRYHRCWVTLEEMNRSLRGEERLP